MRFSVTSREPLAVEIDVAPIINADALAKAREEEGAYARVDPQYGPPDVKTFMFPRFKRRHWKLWQAEIDRERLAQATADMDQVERARTLLLYPLVPLTHGDLRARINTIDGTGFIFATCARAAGVPEHAIARAVDEGDADEIDMESLALMLSGFLDPAEVARRAHELIARQRGKDAPGAGGTGGAAGEEGELPGGGGDLDAFQEDGGASDAPEANPAHPFTPSGGGSKT